MSTFPSQAESLKLVSVNLLWLVCLVLNCFFWYFLKPNFFALCSYSLDTRFFFPSHQLFELELSVMATLRKSVSFSLMGTLATGCLLLIALLVQQGAAVPIRSLCRLDKSNFQQPYITNHTFMLAKEVLISIFLSYASYLLGTWIVLKIFFRAHWRF